MRFPWASVAALVLALGLAGPADATTMRALDLDALVGSADVIVFGTAGAGHTVARGKRFVTLTPLVPARVVKGEVSGEVVVETPGGRVGPIGQRVAGSARFAEGERVVVFLTRLEDGRYRVRGMAQGKLTVTEGEGGGRVARDLSGLELVGDGGAVIPADPDGATLDAFLGELARRVAEPRPARLPAPAQGEVKP